MSLESLVKLSQVSQATLYAPNFLFKANPLTITCHHLCFKSEDVCFSLMHKSIDSMRLLESVAERRYTPLDQPGYTIILYTKDFRIYELTVPVNVDVQSLQQTLEALSNVENLALHYPFYYNPNLNTFNAKFQIMDKSPNLCELLLTGNWRLSHLNKDYSICSTYPSSIIVPEKISEQQLIEISRFRLSGRLPIVIYYHKPRETVLLLAAEPSIYFNVDNVNNASIPNVDTVANIPITTNVVPISATMVSSTPKATNILSSNQTQTRSQISSLINPNPSINRCRADEHLLAAILPNHHRGAILDLRSSAEIKKSTLFTNAVTESDQYYPQWRRISRPMESLVNLNFIFRKLISVCTNSGRLPRSSTVPFGVLQPGTIADSMNLLSTPSSNLSVGNNAFISTNNDTNKPSKLISLLDSVGQLSLSSFDHSSPQNDLRIDYSNKRDITDVNANVRQFGAWLMVVREALGAAVAGATALDARDAFAQQQLQQEQCLFAHRQKDDRTQRAGAKNSDCSSPPNKIAMNEVKLRGSFVLVQSRHGRDRSILVSALIQIILNPGSRTIRGFQTLIDQTWIQLGHPFSIRCRNSAFGSKPSKEESPVFILFLDCVWQILRQYPYAFEFTCELLCLLAKHAYFSEFGTFLGNSMKERDELNLLEQTTSLWSYVNHISVLPRYRNPLYAATDGLDNYACWPCLAPQALDIWQELYQKQLIGNYNQLWDLPRQMVSRLVEKFEAERSKAVQLRNTLRLLEVEATKQGLLSSVDEKII